MARRRKPRHVTRGLRFRLTASYAAFFAILLIGAAAVFRARLSTVLRNQAEDTLAQQWAAMKGYMRIEDFGNKPAEAHWYYDSDDPDETFIVERLRRAFLLTDATGKNEPMFISTSYESMGRESPQEIQDRVRIALATPGKVFWDTRYSDGEPYLVRAGVVFDEQHKAPYYVAIGTPLTGSQKVLRDYTL